MRDLFSHTEVYHVLEQIGKGTFGTVSKCWRSGDGELVAVKMLKFDPPRNRVIRNELKLIRAVCREDLSNCHIVRFFEEFRDQSHQYLVFELLEMSLYQLQRQNGFKPMSVRNIRVITGQMLKALQKLKDLAIIHADVKPENVMLVDHSRYPFRVKLIDFGSASVFSEVRFVKAPYIQSRYYRAPEVLLGLPFSERVDMWSLGCVMSELYLGSPLYPGDSEMEQVRYICETQGLPHAGLLSSASKTHMFFNSSKNSSGATHWQLKTNWRYSAPRKARGQGQGRGEGLGGGGGGQERRKYVLRSLDQLRDMEPREQEAELRREDAEAEDTDRHCMVNLLKRILTLDSNQRISPMSALRHPFLTLAHLSGVARFSCYHHDATQAMEQASLSEMAPAQPPLSPRHRAQDRPNARPSFSSQLREARLPRPGPAASPAGSSCPPCEVPSDGELTQQLDELSFTNHLQDLHRSTEAQKRWERQAAVRSSLADAAASDRDPKGSEALRTAPRSLGRVGVPSGGRVPRPCGGPTGESSSRPYQLFPTAAQSSSTQCWACRPGPDVRTATWTPEAPIRQGGTFSDFPYSLPHPTATPHNPLEGFQQSHHHPQYWHPGTGSHQFPQGERRFLGQLGGQGPRMNGVPSSFLPDISAARGYCAQHPARSSRSDPYHYGVGRCSRLPEGNQETHPPLRLLPSSCTRGTLCTPTRVAPHHQTHTETPPYNEDPTQDRNEVRIQDRNEVPNLDRNEVPTQYRNEVENQDRNEVENQDRNEVPTQYRNEVEIQDKHEVQIPVPVNKRIDVQTQTMGPDQYEVHIHPQPELQVKPQLQQQPQAPPPAGPPSDHHLDLGQPGPSPVFLAGNQPQESRVKPQEIPCQSRYEARDQGAEIDDHQSPSTEGNSGFTFEL